MGLSVYLRGVPHEAVCAVFAQCSERIQRACEANVEQLSTLAVCIKRRERERGWNRVRSVSVCAGESPSKADAWMWTALMKRTLKLLPEGQPLRDFKQIEEPQHEHQRLEANGRAEAR
jgi:hypothetical protein